MMQASYIALVLLAVGLCIYRSVAAQDACTFRPISGVSVPDSYTGTTSADIGQISDFISMEQVRSCFAQLPFNGSVANASIINTYAALRQYSLQDPVLEGDHPYSKPVNVLKDVQSLRGRYYQTDWGFHEAMQSKLRPLLDMHTGYLKPRCYAIAAILPVWPSVSYYYNSIRVELYELRLGGSSVTSAIAQELVPYIGWTVVGVDGQRAEQALLDFASDPTHRWETNSMSAGARFTSAVRDMTFSVRDLRQTAMPARDSVQLTLRHEASGRLRYVLVQWWALPLYTSDGLNDFRAACLAESPAIAATGAQCLSGGTTGVGYSADTGSQLHLGNRKLDHGVSRPRQTEQKIPAPISAMQLASSDSPHEAVAAKPSHGHSRVPDHTAVAGLRATNGRVHLLQPGKQPIGLPLRHQLHGGKAGRAAGGTRIAAPSGSQHGAAALPVAGSRDRKLADAQSHSATKLLWHSRVLSDTQVEDGICVHVVHVAEPAALQQSSQGDADQDTSQAYGWQARATGKSQGTHPAVFWDQVLHGDEADVLALGHPPSGIRAFIVLRLGTFRPGYLDECFQGVSNNPCATPEQEDQAAACYAEGINRFFRRSTDVAHRAYRGYSASGMVLDLVGNRGGNVLLGQLAAVQLSPDLARSPDRASPLYALRPSAGLAAAAARLELSYPQLVSSSQLDTFPLSMFWREGRQAWRSGATSRPYYRWYYDSERKYTYRNTSTSHPVSLPVRVVDPSALRALRTDRSIEEVIRSQVPLNRTNLLLVTDGLCGSMCGQFYSTIERQLGARTMVLGGFPGEVPRATTFEGGFVEHGVDRLLESIEMARAAGMQSNERMYAGSDIQAAVQAATSTATIVSGQLSTSGGSLSGDPAGWPVAMLDAPGSPGDSHPDYLKLRLAKSWRPGRWLSSARVSVNFGHMLDWSSEERPVQLQAQYPELCHFVYCSAVLDDDVPEAAARVVQAAWDLFDPSVEPTADPPVDDGMVAALRQAGVVGVSMAAGATLGYCVHMLFAGDCWFQHPGDPEGGRARSGGSKRPKSRGSDGRVHPAEEDEDEDEGSGQRGGAAGQRPRQREASDSDPPDAMVFVIRQDGGSSLSLIGPGSGSNSASLGAREGASMAGRRGPLGRRAASEHGLLAAVSRERQYIDTGNGTHRRSQLLSSTGSYRSDSEGRKMPGWESSNSKSPGGFSRRFRRSQSCRSVTGLSSRLKSPPRPTKLGQGGELETKGVGTRTVTWARAGDKESSPAGSRVALAAVSHHSDSGSRSQSFRQLERASSRSSKETRGRVHPTAVPANSSGGSQRQSVGRGARTGVSGLGSPGSVTGDSDGSGGSNGSLVEATRGGGSRAGLRFDKATGRVRSVMP